MTKEQIQQQIAIIDKALASSVTPENLKPRLQAKKKEFETALQQLTQAAAAEKKIEVKQQQVAKAKPTTIPAIKKVAEIKKEIKVEKPKITAVKKKAHKTAKQAAASVKSILAKMPAPVKAFNSGRSQGDLKKDARTAAKAPGKHKSAGSGKTYYESRPGHTDIDRKRRLADGGPVIGTGKSSYFAKGGPVKTSTATQAIKDAEFVEKHYGPILKILIDKKYFGDTLVTNAWNSGGGFEHFAIQRPDQHWLVFNPAESEIVLSNKPYQTAEDVYDGFWEDAETFGTKYIPAYNEHFSELRPAQDVANDIINGNWKSLFNEGEEFTKGGITADKSKELAIAFTESLRNDISAADMKAIVKTNKERNDNTCATHDYVDANMNMADAFEKVFGRQFDFGSDNDSDYFNAAWTIAKNNDFSVEKIKADKSNYASGGTIKLSHVYHDKKAGGTITFQPSLMSKETSTGEIISKTMQKGQPGYMVKTNNGGEVFVPFANVAISKEVGRQVAGYASGGAVPDYFGSGTNITVFGYETKNFENCPSAVEEIIRARDHISSETSGAMYDEQSEALVRLAKTIDDILAIEKDCIQKGEATEKDIKTLVMKIAFMGIYNLQAGNIVDFNKFIVTHIVTIMVVSKDGYAKGGRTPAAINKDRRFVNKSQRWETEYQRKRPGKHYMAAGGEIEISLADGGTASKDNVEVAKEIANQLGGTGRLHAMIGAKNFQANGNGLSFRVPSRKANYVKITLNSMDTYDVEYGIIHGDKYKVVATSEGIYNDMLRRDVEENLGMYLSLADGGPVNFAKGGKVVAGAQKVISNSGKALAVLCTSVGNPDFRQDPNSDISPSQFYAVNTLAEASKKCRQYIEDWDLGGGNWNGGQVYDIDGKIIAHISYNGKVWQDKEANRQYTGENLTKQWYAADGP